MKWTGRRQSSNVEDRRGMSGGKAVAGGAGGLIVIGLMVYGLLTGTDTSGLVNMAESLTGGGAQVGERSRELSAEEQRELDFVETVLADTEDVWDAVFRQNGMAYQKPKLVIFTGETESACGSATTSVGPFYCPADRSVYLDTAFFQELKNEFGARMRSDFAGEQGDFAVAYVIAHEIGHHVQNLLGTSGKVHQMEERSGKAEANRWSVALELQADYYAGVFAHYEQTLNHAIEDGDIEGAVSAAAAVGDDAIQKRVRGQVVPDSFTHGSAAQRVSWFKRGYASGDLRKGDTFAELLGTRP